MVKKFFFFLFILSIFVSCKSSEQNNFAESIKTDYSQEDVRNAEIKRIKDLFLNNPRFLCSRKDLRDTEERLTFRLCDR